MIDEQSQQPFNYILECLDLKDQAASCSRCVLKEKMHNNHTPPSVAPALRLSVNLLHRHKWNFPHIALTLTSKSGKFQQPDFGVMGQAPTSKLSND